MLLAVHAGSRRHAQEAVQGLGLFRERERENDRERKREHEEERGRERMTERKRESGRKSE